MKYKKLHIKLAIGCVAMLLAFQSIAQVGFVTPEMYGAIRVLDGHVKIITTQQFLVSAISASYNYITNEAWFESGIR